MRPRKVRRGAGFNDCLGAAEVRELIEDGTPRRNRNRCHVPRRPSDQVGRSDPAVEWAQADVLTWHEIAALTPSVFAVAQSPGSASHQCRVCAIMEMTGIEVIYTRGQLDRAYDLPSVSIEDDVVIGRHRRGAHDWRSDHDRPRFRADDYRSWRGIDDYRCGTRIDHDGRCGRCSRALFHLRTLSE